MEFGSLIASSKVKFYNGIHRFILKKRLFNEPFPQFIKFRKSSVLKRFVCREKKKIVLLLVMMSRVTIKNS